MKYNPLFFIGCFGVGFFGSLLYVKHHKPAAEEREFVCYTEGKLTERHVGVNTAYRDPLSNGGFVIIYNDTLEEKVYTPRRGESCGVEVVR